MPAQTKEQRAAARAAADRDGPESPRQVLTRVQVELGAIPTAGLPGLAEQAIGAALRELRSAAIALAE